MNFGEKHIACVLLADVSGSMSGEAISELNEGLRVFGETLQSDSKAYGCADVCVVSFGSTVEQMVLFCPAAEYTAPLLTAGGLFGEASGARIRSVRIPCGLPLIRSMPVCLQDTAIIP
ncbi:MAG: hypothetical protein ACI4O7_01690 [Aristaeellaceae bacterium]